uniref:F1F0-ATPase inhibitor protein n=2 Tax=Kalanchoe fedtschenkoi TaxID=63787 RepID=A0A7N0UXV0_KALFE
MNILLFDWLVCSPASPFAFARLAQCRIEGSMATRIAARYISRRLSSSGKILSEEEKAAENVYIKKVEKEKLEKLARKGPVVEDKPSTVSGGSDALTDAKPTASTSSTSGVSTDKHRNYAVIAGVVTVFGALGWYLKGSKKTEDVQN